MADIEILLQHRDFLQKLSRALVADESSADDLGQDVWLALIEKETPEVKNWPAWITRVAKNIASNKRRSEGRRKRYESKALSTQDSIDPQEIYQQEQLRRQVIEGLYSLREPYLSTLLYRYYEDLTPTEIARKLDVSIETIKSRLKRGTEMLRVKLDQNFDSRKSWKQALIPVLGIPNSTQASAISSTMLIKGGVLLSIKKILAIVMVALACFFLWPTADGELDQLADTSATSKLQSVDPAMNNSISPSAPTKEVELLQSANSRRNPQDSSLNSSNSTIDSESDALEKQEAQLSRLMYSGGDFAKNVQVTLSLPNPQSPNQFTEAYTTKTNEYGDYRLECEREGPCRVTYGDSTFIPSIELNCHYPSELPSILAIGRRYKLTLQVSAPLNGARGNEIYCHFRGMNSAGGSKLVPWSDDILFHLEKGRYEVVLHTEGYPEKLFELDLSSSDVELEVQLEKPAKNEIVIVDEKGDPIAGAKIKVNRVIASTGHTLQNLTTNHSGIAYAFLQAGQGLDIKVSENLSKWVLIDEEMARTDRLTVQMHETMMLEVNVLNSKQEAVNGVSVDWRCISKGCSVELSMGTFSNEIKAPITHDGKVLLKGLPAANYRLIFKMGEKQLGSVNVRTKSSDQPLKKINYTIPKEFKVNGRVFHNGSLVNGGRLQCGAASSPVDSKGNFSISINRIGINEFKYTPLDYEYIVNNVRHNSANGDFGNSWTATYRVEENKDVSIDFVDASLSAIVYDEDGEALADYTGTLLGPSEIIFRTDYSGKVNISRLIAGPYEWTAKRSAGVHASPETFVVEGETSIELHLKKSRVIHLQMTSKDAHAGWIIYAEGLGANGRRCKIVHVKGSQYNIPKWVEFIRAFNAVNEPSIFELEADIADYNICLEGTGGKLTIVSEHTKHVEIKRLDGESLAPPQQSLLIEHNMLTEPLPTGKYKIIPDRSYNAAVEVEITEGGSCLIELP